MDLAHVIGIFAFTGLIFTAAFFQLSILSWTALLGVGLFLLTYFDWLSPVFVTIFWLGYLLAAAFANLHSLRQRYIIQPALKVLRKQLPTISRTEREAIEAGNTWWEKELFCGRPSWQQLTAIPKPTLTQAEQDFIDNQVEHLCSMLNDWEIVFEEKNLPHEVWSYLKAEKFFGMVIPKEYGGLGFSALAHSTVVSKIATRSISAAVNTMVPNSLGPAELLLHYGTPEQKSYYLPRLANGVDIPCFALTGPEAGSDAGAIPDTGIVCKMLHQGKETVGIRLNWDKRYITLAPVATVLGLAVHLYDPDHLLGAQTDVGITLCLIPTTHPGVQTGDRHYPLHLAFMNGPTRGKDVFIPMDWIIGGPQMAGQGWRMLMECLSIGRAISLPALATACGKLTYRNAGAYARVRRQFNTPLAAFEGIEEALGYIAGYTYILEASRVMTAGAVDLRVRPSTASAIAKYHMTELARQVIEHAMDVHAGHAIQVGPRNYLANLHFAMPISITVEGANILTRNLMIFGQGAIRCHPYLLKEIELISAADPNVGELDAVLMSHTGFLTSNFLRTLVFGITGGRWICTTFKNSRVRKCQRQLTRMSTALAFLADVSLIMLGGSLKRRERLSARLGDILSQLYLSSAVLKYFHDQHQPHEEVDYVCWSLQHSLYKIQIACDELLDNFPNRWAGKLFRWIVFPWGRSYMPPRDYLHKRIVTPMLEPSELRERLTKYCFVSKQEDDLGNRLDAALARVAAVEPAWKKLQKAVQSGEISIQLPLTDRLTKAEQSGLLTSTETQMIAAFEKLRSEIIQVNEFSFNLDRVIA